MSDPNAAPTAEPQPDRWSASDPDVVIGEQLPVAVYENIFGAVVIRQEARGRDEEDQTVVIRPENLHRLIDALIPFLPPGPPL